jgi:hypothetical protein
MAEKRFSDTLKDISTALAGADKTVQKQVRAAAEAAAPKWKKTGKLDELKGLAAALPEKMGADFMVALGEEIAVRGREWAQQHLFAALGEFVKGLEGVGSEA